MSISHRNHARKTPQHARRALALVLILVLILQVRCLSIAGLLIGDSRRVQKPGVGYLTGFTADILAAVKIGGTAGAYYAGLTIFFPLGVLLIGYLSKTPPDPDIEFPLFRRSPEGDALRKFVRTDKITALVIDPGPALEPRGGEERFSFAAYSLPKRTQDILYNGYLRFHLMDQHPDLGPIRGLRDVMHFRSRYNEGTKARLIFHVRFMNPVTSCGVEDHQDEKCVKSTDSDPKSDAAVGACEPKPTGFRILRVPVEGTLIRIDSGETLNARAEGPVVEVKEFSSVGQTECPYLGHVFDAGFNKSIRILMRALIPAELRARQSRMITKEDSSSVKKRLSDGVALVKGDSPDLDKALVHWKEALEMSGGKSEGALGNLGVYALVNGDFEKAVEYFNRASEAKGADKKYWGAFMKAAEDWSVP